MWPFKRKEYIYSDPNEDETVEDKKEIPDSPIDYHNHLGTYYTDCSIENLRDRVSRVNKILNNTNKLNTALINEERWLKSVISFKAGINNTDNN